MEHMHGFNEEFKWDKLNIFSKKKKEELKKKEEVNEDDEALANAIFYEITGKVVGRDVKRHQGGLLYEIDGDKIVAYPRGLSINGEKIDCSQKVIDRFYKYFEVQKENDGKANATEKAKAVKDKLKAKYKK